MAAPVYSAGTPGNLINGVSVSGGATISAFLDLSAAIEGQIVCEIVTGGTAPTAATVFSIYRAYAAGTSAPITVGTGGISAGGTSLPVSSVTGLKQGQMIALQKAGTPPQLGEIVTITAAVTASPITISATVNSYSSGDSVYYITQTPVLPVSPGPATGTWATNKDYSVPVSLGTSQYVIAANNTSTATVTVSLTLDKVTSYQ